MSIAEVVAWFLEILVFAGFSFAAAALRGSFKVPRLHETTVAAAVALLLVLPLGVGAAVNRGLQLSLLSVGALAANFVGISAGLRFSRP